MKKVLISLMIILVGQVYGQQSTSPLPMANKWTILSHDVWNQSHSWSEGVVQVVGDTTFNGMTYQIIDGNYILPCYVRYSSDLLQMYVYSTKSKHEYLLCDFSKQVGERMELLNGNDFSIYEEQIYETSWVVQSKELIGDRYHIVLSKENSNPEMTVSFVQGIGSPSLFFTEAGDRNCYGCVPMYTLCAFHNDEQIYSFDLSKAGIINNCPDWEYVPSALESAPAEPSARLILRDGHILVEREDAVYSIMGQQVK